MMTQEHLRREHREEEVGERPAPSTSVLNGKLSTQEPDPGLERPRAQQKSRSCLVFFMSREHK